MNLKKSDGPKDKDLRDNGGIKEYFPKDQQGNNPDFEGIFSKGPAGQVSCLFKEHFLKALLTRIGGF